MIFYLKTVYQQSMIKQLLTLTVFFCVTFNAFTQENKNAQIQEVFNKLVAVYGSAKPAPKFVIRKTKSPQPAEYVAQPKPTIFIDEQVYIISQRFGKDNLNALSVIISHELAHYYGDHTFCMDYAVASRKQNKDLATTILKSSLNSRIEKETEADQKGLFYAAAAGYKPFNLYSDFITRLYSSYQLPDDLEGYPSKQERITIAENAKKKALELYGYFQEGLSALKTRQYDKAIKAFETANSFIPFRENYNNLGVAKTRKALYLKVPTSEDYKSKKPKKRFEYPLEVDYESRLNQEMTRGLDDNSDTMQQLLKSAQRDFDKAISLDPNYTKGYINLACVYDLLENYYLAIGTINRLPINQRNTKDAQRIYAIAHYHADMEDKAEVIWKKLKM